LFESSMVTLSALRLSVNVEFRSGFWNGKSGRNEGERDGRRYFL
jgi:hypothetical protein